jgi:DNA/RNA endonuclease YhcR with UshA esterase domain
MCGAKTGGLSVEGIDVAKETVIQGTVTADGQPVGGAFVRLLDGTGEFTAEVVTSATGEFRFFARPGDWTLRALSWQGNGETSVKASQGEVTEATVALAK